MWNTNCNYYLYISINLRKNFINLEFANFNITERGDLRDIVNFRNTGGDLVSSDPNTIPSFDDL